MSASLTRRLSTSGRATRTRTSPATGSTSIIAPSGMSTSARSRADHRRDAQLAGDDRGVAHRPTLGGDHAAGQRQHQVVGGRGAGDDQDVARLEHVERLLGRRRHPRDAADRLSSRCRRRAGRCGVASPSMPMCCMTVCTMPTSLARLLGSTSSGGADSAWPERQRRIERPSAPAASAARSRSTSSVGCAGEQRRRDLVGRQLEAPGRVG